MANEQVASTQNDLSREFFAHEYWRSHGALRLMRRYTPFWVRRALRTPYLFALDSMDLVLGRRDGLVPPRYLNYADSGGFAKVGKEFLGYYKERCGLQPQGRVLDMGCGIGRMAVPLTGYLTTGSYEGFDIVASGVGWCKKNITPKFPRFKFQIADIYNKQYNPRGRYQPGEYRFPFSDAEFDLVILISVFTHMLPSDMDHYLSEISRVLKPGGKCLITFFMNDEEARRRVAAGTAAVPFDHKLNGCWTSDPVTPETAVGYDPADVMPVFKKHSLQPDPTYFGAWSGRSNYLSYQDIVIATKAGMAKQ
jgi:SAM-dependent methyltransferase